jgi:protein dispatched 1
MFSFSGIGADDAFIFVKIWQCVLTERVKASSMVTTSDRHSDILLQTMSYTFRHAALSMLTTSLTTACAFYASYVSSITAVRCFGIFSGTAIIVNYMLMISWLPACISIAEKMSCLSFKFKNLTLLRLSFFKSLSHVGTRIEDSIISIVVYLPYLCIAVLGRIF